MENEDELEWRAGVLYGLGHNLDKETMFEKAETHLKHSIELNPNLFDSHVELGDLYVNSGLGKAEDAQNEFYKALDLAKNDNERAGAHNGLYFAFYYQGKMREALSAADDYLFIYPENETMRGLKKLVVEEINSGAKKEISEKWGFQFELPSDEWVFDKKSEEEDGSKAAYYFVRYGIDDGGGRMIFPAISFIFEKLDRDVKLDDYVEFWKGASPFNNKGEINGDLLGKLENSIGYLGTHNKDQFEEEHMMDLVYAIKKDVGLTAVMDSTTKVFDFVKSDFDETLKTLSFSDSNVDLNLKYPVMDFPEFRFEGNWIACVIPKGYQRGENEDLYGGCSRIGDIKTGMNRSEIEKIIGLPRDTFNDEKLGMTSIYYTNNSDNDADMENSSYLAVSYDNDLARIVQMTGLDRIEKMSFSSIYLGDNASKVIEIFGKPKIVSMVGEIRGQLWLFSPFNPFEG